MIPYTGLTSGCTNAPGGNPNCVAGEIIEFKIGDGIEATDCYIEYGWDFGQGLVPGQATETYVFAKPGLYPVKLTISIAGGFSYFSTTVPVVSPFAIPAERPLPLVLLAFILGTIGLVSLRIVASR